jgi:hypothetical protein
MNLGDCLLKGSHHNNATLGYGLGLLFALLILAVYSIMYILDPRITEHYNMTVKSKIRKQPGQKTKHSIEMFFNFFLAVEYLALSLFHSYSFMFFILFTFAFRHNLYIFMQ